MGANNSRSVHTINYKRGHFSLLLETMYCINLLDFRLTLPFILHLFLKEYLALCFDPTSSPRVFTQVVSVVASHLKKQNIRLAIYLDNWLGVNQVKQKLIQDREIMLNLLARLGFLINVDKSNLTPNQSITYLLNVVIAIKNTVFQVIYFKLTNFIGSNGSFLACLVLMTNPIQVKVSAQVV
jgi:hypothetical protein